MTKDKNEFKPGKAPRRGGWMPGDTSKGRIMTRHRSWIPLPDPPPEPRRRLWLSVVLATGLVLFAAVMAVHG